MWRKMRIGDENVTMFAKNGSKIEAIILINQLLMRLIVVLPWVCRSYLAKRRKERDQEAGT